MIVAKYVKQIAKVTEHKTQDHAKFINSKVNVTRWEFQRTLVHKELMKSDPQYRRKHYFKTDREEYRAAIDALVRSSLWNTSATHDQQVVKITGVFLKARQSCR